jgi:hypothetical protein
LGLYGWAGYGNCPSHSRWYWGSKLLFICTCEGTVTGFGLANPNWLRQKVEAIIWTPKRQLGLERHGSRVPAGAVGPHRVAPARTQRLHLAQLADRRAGQALPHRVRSLSCA